jgi:hypothetical protein
MRQRPPLTLPALTLQVGEISDSITASEKSKVTTLPAGTSS